VRSLLDALLVPEPDWRGPGPLVAGDAPGTFDEASVAAITAQLARAAGVLGALRGDSAEVARVWSTMVQSPAPGVAPQLAPRAQVAPVEPERRLCVRRDGNFFAMATGGGTGLLLVVGTNRELELTGAAMHFVRRILSERSFRCGDCTDWVVDGTRFAWSDVQDMLTRLEREGLLEQASSEDR
jgi:hypothetical protein